MALGAISALDDTRAGLKPSAPLSIEVVEFEGDDAYTTGGTLAFEAAVQAACGRGLRIVAASGEGYSGTLGAITHWARYDRETDALLVYAVGGAQAAAAANLSATTFRVTVWAE